MIGSIETGLAGAAVRPPSASVGDARTADAGRGRRVQSFQSFQSFIRQV